MTSLATSQNWKKVKSLTVEEVNLNSHVFKKNCQKLKHWREEAAVMNDDFHDFIIKFVLSPAPQKNTDVMHDDDLDDLMLMWWWWLVEEVLSLGSSGRRT